MAGLGETCSHIAVILFTLDANVQVKQSMSCTLTPPCSWLPPSFKNVSFAPISNIDFSAPDIKIKTNLEKSIASSSSSSEKIDIPGVNNKITPSSNELMVLYKKLSEAGTTSLF